MSDDRRKSVVIRRQRLNERLRAEFMAGAEEDSANAWGEVLRQRSLSECSGGIREMSSGS